MQINQGVYIKHYQMSEVSLSGRLLLYLFVDIHCACAVFMHAGLQASPSKHTSYSVRMENAVPIVTQAPGAQPLQIQPGLLTQVGRH